VRQAKQAMSRIGQDMQEIAERFLKDRPELDAVPADIFKQRTDNLTDERIEALQMAKSAHTEAKAVYDAAEAAGRSQNPSEAAYRKAKGAYTECPLLGFDLSHKNMLCIIDTYAQTAEDDNRTNVSAYIKNLRTLVEEAHSEGVTLSFLVVDHVTKEGSTYLGSVAKINDVDSQLEVSRLRKSMLATITQTKSKDGAESAPMSVEMTPFEIRGYTDASGRPLSTLVARDGSSSAAALALNPEGNSAMILDMLQGAEGLMAEVDLKASFKQVKIAAGVKPESADKAYRRAMQSLKEDGCVRDVDGDISLA